MCSIKKRRHIGISANKTYACKSKTDEAHNWFYGSTSIDKNVHTNHKLQPANRII